MILELPAEMVLARAREVREQLLAAFARGEPLELDARRLESVDAAGLQLLCGLHKSMVARGSSLSFCDGNEGPVLEAATARAGFKRHQGCTAGCLWARTSP